jgi:hypothetical protein
LKGILVYQYAIYFKRRYSGSAAGKSKKGGAGKKAQHKGRA